MGASAAGCVMTAMWLQEPDAISSGNAKLLMIFIGLVALAMLTQAVVVVALGLGAMKAQKKVMAMIEELKQKAMPLVGKGEALYAKAEALYADLEPKIRTVTENVTETSTMVKNKVHDFEGTLAEANATIKSTLAEVNQTVKAVNATALEVNERAKAQVERVDEMVTGVLKKTDEVAATLQRGITAPGRAISNMAHGVKGQFDSLVERMKASRKPERRVARPVTSVRPTSPTPVNARPVSTMRDLSPTGMASDIDL